MNIEQISRAEVAFAAADAANNEPKLNDSVHAAAVAVVECHGLEDRHSGGNAHRLRTYVATPGGRVVYGSPENFCRCLPREKREKIAVAALAADQVWEAAVTAELVKFTGDLTVRLVESRTEGPGRQGYAQCGKTFKQVSGLNGDFPSGRPQKSYEDPVAWAQWRLEIAAITAASAVASIPGAPVNRVHHDRLYGSYTMTDSWASLPVIVSFVAGQVTGTQVGTVETEKYSNV